MKDVIIDTVLFQAQQTPSVGCAYAVGVDCDLMALLRQGPGGIDKNAVPDAGGDDADFHSGTLKLSTHCASTSKDHSRLLCDARPERCSSTMRSTASCLNQGASVFCASRRSRRMGPKSFLIQLASGTEKPCFLRCM